MQIKRTSVLSSKPLMKGMTFIARQLGSMPEDVISSTDTDYVMSRIRQDYIKDSTVTIVLAGKCTWAHRYVDWEVQASLRSGETVTTNGLLGIKLPTFAYWPERFNSKLLHQGQTNGYVCWLEWSATTADALSGAVESAFARCTTHTPYIVNPRDRLAINRQCE
jgi:hypothetical protein